MTITKTLEGDTLTVRTEGWLDTMTAPQFHAAVQDLEAAEHTVLDLGGVDYISSAGLREVVALFRSVTERGGSFSVRRVRPGVADVFTMTGFNKKMDIRGD